MAAEDGLFRYKTRSEEATWSEIIEIVHIGNDSQYYYISIEKRWSYWKDNLWYLMTGWLSESQD